MCEKTDLFKKIFTPKNAEKLVKRFIENGETPQFVMARFLPDTQHLFLNKIEYVVDSKFTAIKSGKLEEILKESASNIVLVLSANADISKSSLAKYQSSCGCELVDLFNILTKFNIELSRSSEYKLCLKENITIPKPHNSLCVAHSEYRMKVTPPVNHQLTRAVTV